MRPLRYSINVTLDGCCDHRVMSADEELHRHAVTNLERADAGSALPAQSSDGLKVFICPNSSRAPAGSATLGQAQVRQHSRYLAAAFLDRGKDAARDIR